MTLFVSHQFMYALAWTLLHSLWQISLIALVLYLVIVYSKKSSSRFRYGFATLSMILSVVLMIGTFIVIYLKNPADAGKNIVSTHPTTAFTFTLPVEKPMVLTQSSLSESSEFFPVIHHFINRYGSFLVALWMVGVLLLSLRLLGGLAYTKRLKNHPNNRIYRPGQETIIRLSEKLGFQKPVQVMLSGVVGVPMVIGQLKPVILLPVALVTTLPINQVEALLAHELAHIYRRDYWVNIFQSLAEIIFFYHPALWWISSVIRTERENCCDDLAVSLCHNKLTYAKALTQVEISRQQSTGLAMAVTGVGGSLLQRIERLLHPHGGVHHSAGRYISVIAIFLIVLSAGSVMAFKNHHWPLHQTLQHIFYLPNDPADKQPTAAEKMSSRVVERLGSGSFLSNTPRPLPTAATSDEAAHKENYLKRYATITLRKTAERDTLRPILPEDQELLLDINLDSVAPDIDLDIDLDLDIDENFELDLDLDTLPDFSHAYSFQWHSSDTSGMALWTDGKTTFFSDTLLPPNFYYFSDSLLEKFLHPLDSFYSSGFQWHSSHFQQQIEEQVARAQEQMHQFYEQWGDSIPQMDLSRLQEQLQRSEKTLKAQSEALARQAERMKKQAEALEKKAAELEAKASKQEKTKAKIKAKESGFDVATRVLEKQLLEDGYIEEGKQYTFDIKENQLRINGKTQSKKVYQKYADLLDKEMNINLENGGNFSLTKTPFE